jgi:IMP dehydrogenase
MICIETAHAQNTHALRFVSQVKKAFPQSQLCVSFVVTKEATRDVIKAGADCIRVGIGGGSHCTTRLVTGIGRPQLSALEECVSESKKYGIPIISDTGIKHSGDIPKALLFGASAVMIGGLFAATKESPGNIVRREGKDYKMSWGMCTNTAMNHGQIKKTMSSISLSSLKGYVRSVIYRKKYLQRKQFEEGVEFLLPYKGSVRPVIEDLLSGTRRAMWYMGAKSISDISKKGTYVLVSPRTNLENIPRIPSL